MKVVKVEVWGEYHDEGAFHQLDNDPEQEYVVVSRNRGTGPYYRLQIIDFHEDGILTWSYHSGGGPRIEDGVVFLGRLPNGYQGAATKAVYSRYRLSASGLSKVGNVE
jgi:hypothetical protein